MDFQKGLVKETCGQQKKHITQMTDTDKDNLRLMVANVRQQWLRRGVKLSNHLQEKLLTSQTTFSLGLAMDTILNGQLIEFNIVPSGDKRVLLRSNKSFICDGKEVNQCIVVSLKTFKIVTSFLNEVVDNHGTINYTRYNKDLEVK